MTLPGLTAAPPALHFARSFGLAMATMALLLVLAALGIVLSGSVLAALPGRRDRFALLAGTAGTVLGGILGVVGSVLALLDGGETTRVAPWQPPVGALRIGLDPLSAFFLLCIFLVSGLGALYGAGYFKAWLGHRRIAPVASLGGALVLAMAGVVLARDAVMFLMAWEAMTVTSFFLVTSEGDHKEARRAGITYLVASQLGVVPLFVLFASLSVDAGGTDFAALAGTSPGAEWAGVCFVLALIGFGTKAGFWPLHVWLPEAHPAAPSPVSAVLSGVMIKMGIYGLLRVLTFLPTPPASWGVVLVLVGTTSGLGGVIHALAQHDLKRLLAYHSVENIGIIALGLGLGLLGQAWGDPTVAFLGYAGALLHVMNHGLFKGLLFQGAGAVLHATGRRDLDSLGGLLRRMPVTGATFLTGSAAISGLPPFNGFVSELLLFAAAFRGAAVFPVAGAVWALAVAPVLAAIGGLAVACFIKAFGIVFLGEPRTPAAADAREVPRLMRAAMIAGAGLCVAVGVAPMMVLPLVGRVAAGFAGGGGGVPPVVSELLWGVSVSAAVLVGLVGVLLLVRHALLRTREVRSSSTWGCGYEAPTARMQYTASSFAEPVLAPSLSVLGRAVHQHGPTGPFPPAAHFEEHLGDLAADHVVAPAAAWLVAVLGRAQALQRGGARRYLVYVLATLVVLLVWQLGGIG